MMLTLSTSTFAMLCPTNFQSISVGDSIDMVTTACGKPLSQTTHVSTTSLPQEWNYYVKSTPTDQATLKMTVAFDQGVVTNMSVNGIGVSNTAICGNTVQVGDTVKTVQSACGKPAFIMQGNAPQSVTGDENPASTKVTELTYNTGASIVTLTFENGRLVDKK